MNVVQPIRDKKQIDAMAKALRASNERNWLLFMTGINTGLRISDLLRLRVRDVRQRRHLDLREKKTGKLKRAAIRDDLYDAFQIYTDGLADNVFLFRSKRGANKPLSRSGAYKVLRAAADQVGLRDIGTHTLRKTFGYHLYRDSERPKLGLLQKLFNHSSEEQTLRYIGVVQDELDAAVHDHGLGMDFG